MKNIERVVTGLGDDSIIAATAAGSFFEASLGAGDDSYVGGDGEDRVQDTIGKGLFDGGGGGSDSLGFTFGSADPRVLGISFDLGAAGSGGLVTGSMRYQLVDSSFNPTGPVLSFDKVFTGFEIFTGTIYNDSMTGDAGANDFTMILAATPCRWAPARIGFGSSEMRRMTPFGLAKATTYFSEARAASSKPTPGPTRLCSRARISTTPSPTSPARPSPGMVAYHL